MPNDLCYFHESNLNNGDIGTFLNSLPNHLQRKFEDSFGDFDVIKLNVLQGYRGPHDNGGSGDSEYLGSSNGLQEVRYWWGVSKQFLSQDADWHSLYFDSKTGECLSHNKNEAAEKLNKAHQLFQERKCIDAEEYHNDAYQACSSGYEYKQTFKNNRNIAKAELDAANLNLEGDNLYSQSKYTEALGKYQEAYNQSRISEQYNKYWSNIEKTKAELDAASLNSDGDNLYSQSKYTEALGKYQEAYNQSQNSKEYNKYYTNKERAAAEIDAKKLNSEGDHLFKLSKYTESLIKYQAAYDKSVVEKEKNKYSFNFSKAQALKNKLLKLDNLWKEAWEAENDTANDRYSEAKELFEKVLTESKDSLKIFPYCLRFKRYKKLSSIKIDGNELYNEGLEAQQDGFKLFQEAQELKLQQNFLSALTKYKEAKSKLYEAKEKFKTGRESDQQFVSCIDFVQKQLNKVLQSIQVIEQHR